MNYSFTVSRPLLKVLSALLSNLGAGLLIIPLTVHNFAVLTSSIGLAIVFLGIAIKIEQKLEKYD